VRGQQELLTNSKIVWIPSIGNSFKLGKEIKIHYDLNQNLVETSVATTNTWAQGLGLAPAQTRGDTWWMAVDDATVSLPQAGGPD
jgi:hypothetical protein